MNLLVSLLIGGIVGYALGLIRPIRRARNWAHWKLRLGTPGRLAQALILVLLPELTARALWRRLRHGAWPEPPKRRPAPALSDHWREKTTTPDPLPGKDT
jgi:hypothetical protein